MKEDLLNEAVGLLRRWTTADVTGHCVACRDMTIRHGGKTPNVLDGQPHRSDCPIGKFAKKVEGKST